MMKMLRLCVLLLACSPWFGCGDDGGGGGTADASTGDASGEFTPLYEPCTTPSECEFGICHLYGTGDMLCTKACEVDADCPPPPTGGESPGCSPNRMVCKRPGSN